MKAPAHWYPPAGKVPATRRLMGAALLPFGLIYAVGGRVKRLFTNPVKTGLPVICVGNLTAGGTGKTPLTMALAARFRASGRKPHILTRGYGGALRGPVLVKPDVHVAADVGDEPLLLSRAAPTWVSRRRGLGALAAVAGGADLLLMDDGFQNAEIEKTVSLLVIDGEVGLGNGLVLPAGPLRETALSGFARADAIIVMGPQSLRTARQITSFQGPVFHAELLPTLKATTPENVLAFAGIGRPEKFFASVKSVGFEAPITRSFPDHHVFSDAEIDKLRRDATAHDLTLLTTEKDWIRLPESQRRDIKPFPVTARIKEEASFDAFLAAQLAIFDRSLQSPGSAIASDDLGAPA